MASPLKNLSKFVSSPKFLSGKSPKFLNVSSVDNEHVFHRKRADLFQARNLQSKSPSKFVGFPKSPSKCGEFSVAIKVTECDEFLENKNVEDVILNTPNKNSLLRNGLEKNLAVNVLGRGSFGTVFRGVYKDKTVAVKMLNRKDATREKHALNLHHKNIVKTLDVIENVAEKFAMVLMEYFPCSKSLQSLLDHPQSKIETRLLKKFITDICEAVAYCHARNFLHLDLKPANILVCDGDVCRICDFGNSCNVSEISGKENYQGTAVYTAPEILSGSLPTTKSDVYSLGVIFWQLKHWKTPYDQYDHNETVIYKVVKDGLRPDCDENEEAFCRIHKKCWSQRPEDRPEVRDILGQFC